MTKKELILKAACDVAEKKGFNRMTRQDVAGEAGVPESLVSHYYGPMPELRTAVLLQAIKTENLILLAQGLAFNHPVAVAAPLNLKVRVSHMVVGDV